MILHKIIILYIDIMYSIYLFILFTAYIIYCVCKLYIIVCIYMYRLLCVYICSHPRIPRGDSACMRNHPWVSEDDMFCSPLALHGQIQNDKSKDKNSCDFNIQIQKCRIEISLIYSTLSRVLKLKLQCVLTWKRIQAPWRNCS